MREMALMSTGLELDVASEDELALALGEVLDVASEDESV
jgi:hypothetical protein